VRNSSVSRFGFIVLNRLEPENLLVEITADLQIQQSGDYLMYKLADGIRG
jgi:hypothetical protein